MTVACESEVEYTDDMLVDDSVKIFKENISLLESQIEYAEGCYAAIQKTLSAENAVCGQYVATREFTDEFTAQAIALLVALFDEGYIVNGDPRFEEIITLVEYLALKSKEAEDADQDLVDILTGNCTKDKKCMM